MYGTIIFNSIYSIVFTSFYWRDKNKNLEKFNIYLIYIPTLITKFYYFTLNYYCLCYSKIQKGNEILSGSLIISIYLSIIDFIYKFARDYDDISKIDSILIIQIISSISILTINILIILIGAWKNRYNHSIFTVLICLACFSLCCGGSKFCGYSDFLFGLNEDDNPECWDLYEESNRDCICSCFCCKCKLCKCPNI